MMRLQLPTASCNGQVATDLEASCLQAPQAGPPLPHALRFAPAVVRLTIYVDTKRLLTGKVRVKAVRLHLQSS